MQTKSRAIRLRWTAAEKAELVAAFHRSGLSQRDFGLQHSLAPSNIGRWVRQAQEPVREPTRAAAFVEVPNLLSSGSNGSPYRLHFPKGLTLEVARGFAPEEVRALARVLQGL